jgi:hypothetical protein
MLETGSARTTVLRETAGRPMTFLELLDVAHVSYGELTKLLEALISEGSIGKTSDGFQTLYVFKTTPNSP